MLTIHLDAKGRDEGDGSKRRPVATLKRALELRRSGSRRIVAGGGQYFDTEVTLTAADSGLRIVAAPGETPVFLGGVRVAPWRAEGAFWVADFAPEIRALVVNGRFAPRARYPEVGVLEHATEFKTRWMSTTGGGWERKPTDEELSTLRLLPCSLPEGLSERDAELTVHHSWDESLVGVKHWDREAGTITFSTPAGHPPGAFDIRKFVVWNVREGMTRPGQWYQDRARGRLVYWPSPGDTLESLEVLAPTRTAILRLDGTEETPIRDVQLKGVAFALTTTPLIAGSFGAQKFEGAIEGQHVQGLRLEGVDARWTGGQAVRLNHCAGLRCRGCHFHDLGAGGARFEGSDGVIEDCLVHHVGLTYPSAIALRLGGERWRVRHNTFHHTPYSAIASGGEDLRFESNRFHHVMEVMEDGAAIYIFAAKSCVIRGNYTHDVRDAKVHAYYLDERSSDSLVVGNVAENVPWALHNHMGWNCVLRDNVCLSSEGMKFTLAVCDQFVLERNVLVCESELAFNGGVTSIARLRHNCFYSRSGNYRWEFNDLLPTRQRNTAPMPTLPLNQGSLLADPGCRCEGGKISYQNQELAAKLGLPCLDVSQAGRRGQTIHGVLA